MFKSYPSHHRDSHVREAVGCRCISGLMDPSPAAAAGGGSGCSTCAMPAAVRSRAHAKDMRAHVRERLEVCARALALSSRAGLPTSKLEPSAVDAASFSDDCSGPVVKIGRTGG